LGRYKKKPLGGGVGRKTRRGFHRPPKVKKGRRLKKEKGGKHQ